MKNLTMKLFKLIAYIAFFFLDNLNIETAQLNTIIK